MDINKYDKIDRIASYFFGGCEIIGICLFLIGLFLSNFSVVLIGYCLLIIGVIIPVIMLSIVIPYCFKR